VGILQKVEKSCLAGNLKSTIQVSVSRKSCLLVNLPDYTVISCKEVNMQEVHSSLEGGQALRKGKIQKNKEREKERGRVTVK
jgi:hypothetical protein